MAPPAVHEVAKKRARPQKATAIDLFAGAGGFSTGAKMAGVEVVWAANHWRLAVDVHAQNHPGAEHSCQDLQQADWRAVPAHDILLASPSCVPGDQLVVMADGREMHAEEIVLGDMVLTHEGRGRQIVNIWKKQFTGPMCELSMWGDTKKKTRMTADHLVWVRRRGGHFSRLGAPQFIRADEVRSGDYVAYPRGAPTEGAAALYVEERMPNRVEYPVAGVILSGMVRLGKPVAEYFRKGHVNSMPGAKVRIDPEAADLWWLVGHYLGDGQARNDREEIGWSVGGTVENLVRVRAALKGLGLRSWEKGPDSNRLITTSSTHLRAICEAFGRLAHVKRIPEDLYRIEHRHLEALVDGYLAADGNVKVGRSNPMWNATSVSLELLQGLQRICWLLGWSASISRCDYARARKIQGRDVQCRDSWAIGIVKTPHSQSRTKFDDSHVWRSVKTVEIAPVQNVEVFDFEVEEDHTFCLPGIVVHNCQGHSRARGADKPHHDTQRSTAWAVVSCAEYHREHVVVVENVPEFATWPLYPAWLDAMRRLGYAVSPHLIDAANHGVPQHRARLFLVCTRSKAPLQLKLPRGVHVPIASVIDWDSPKWTPIHRPGRSRNTLARISSGRARFGDRFVAPYYGSGSGTTGRSIDRPLGTVTTIDRWAVIDGDRMRMMQRDELRAAMAFPDGYVLPRTHKEAVHLLGNAVCPPVPRDILVNLLEQA